MSLAEAPPTAVDVIFENIFDFLLPFFLAAAGGKADLARAAIQELAEAYDATTVTELDLVGRILGFSVVAMDNLRLSMNQGMSDTKILRYRSNAVALSRAGEQCRKILEVVQGQRNRVRTAEHAAPPRVPGPAIEPAPPVQMLPARRPGSLAAIVPPGGLPDDFLSGMPNNIAAMKRDARILMAAFSRNDAASGPAIAAVPKAADPSAMVDAAVRQAFVQSRGQAGRR